MPCLPPSASPAGERLHAALCGIARPGFLDEWTSPNGDLSGNVLFHAELPPAIIDCAAYWRPVAFVFAIVVADALVWEGAEIAQQVRRRLDKWRATGSAHDVREVLLLRSDA